MKCGLLGRKLGHSYSPQIHALMGNDAYVLIEKEPQEVGPFLRQGDFTGINVTIPYKKEVIPFLDELSPVAQRMGAVNTIIRRPDGSLFGHNTDYFGFSSMVKQSEISVADKKVLVLGSGGASNTAVKVLEDMGAQVVIISRTGENNYDNLYLHKDASVIVNTTPVGMYPNTGVSPIVLSSFPKLEGVLDMIYNPARTKLLMDATEAGLPCANGLWMLVAQAKEAAEYFCGRSLPDDLIERVHLKLSSQMQNIILIGMPGCGKSTIAYRLAQKLGRRMVDSDVRITELADKKIPDIFSEDGENEFRKWETKALEELGKQSCLVVATGGGCVTKSRNYRLLHQNGVIFWVKRDIMHLPVEGRPLSLSGKLDEMYAQRKPMYEAFADYVIDNNGSVDDAVWAIMSHLEEAI